MLAKVGRRKDDTKWLSLLSNCAGCVCGEESALGRQAVWTPLVRTSDRQHSSKRSAYARMA